MILLIGYSPKLLRLLSFYHYLNININTSYYITVYFVGSINWPSFVSLFCSSLLARDSTTGNGGGERAQIINSVEFAILVTTNLVSFLSDVKSNNETNIYIIQLQSDKVNKPNGDDRIDKLDD
jgi:hypothetical protein